MTLSAGDVIAGYRLEEQIGRGGMGVVYRATHVALERKGAVKLIAPELAANEDFRRRFQRESRLAASIDHPHVIPVFDAGEEDGQLYVAMRYVQGTDLGALLGKEGPLTPERAVDVVAQVADALDAAHELGLVHRDVKPANILLETRGSGYHAYLTDFGLVKAMGAASGVLTRTGQWLGTPDFAAPEQILGGEVDARTDVYALGCILYQAIAGKPPYVRDTDVAKVFAHLQEPPPTLSAARPGVTDVLDGVVRTALAKAPEERQASAGALAAAARAAIEAGPGAPERRPPLAAPTARAPEARTTAALPRADTASAPAGPSTGRKRSRLLFPGIALAVLVAGVAIALVAGGGGDGGGGGDSPTGEGDGGGGGGGGTAVIPAGNLTSNPSFESDTSGWDFSGSSIASEPADDAPDGERVVRVTQEGASTDYSIDDDPDTVDSSSAGTPYTATAWVKATESTDGAPLCISIRERPENGGGDFPLASASVTASANEWREVSVTHQAEASGMRIDVHVFRVGGDGEGEEFLADAITLTENGEPADPGADEGHC
jgi:serine/threonine-protein kinase